jgi:choline dehydrogenase-like flavoprotein
MDMQELQTTLQKGMRVTLLERGVEVAQGTITRLLPGELEFTDGDPKYKDFAREFAYKREWGGWKKLHEDPFTRGRCTSEFGAIYMFVPIETS